MNVKVNMNEGWPSYAAGPLRGAATEGFSGSTSDPMEVVQGKRLRYKKIGRGWTLVILESDANFKQQKKDG